MKVISIKRKSKAFVNFKENEWKLIHPKHYGKEYNEKYWDDRHLYLEVKDGIEIVGVLTGEMMAGVLYIPELIVKKNRKNQGIGKLLMIEAENWARKNKAHEIDLVTGTGWQAVKFYENLGFKSAFILDKYYLKIDFHFMRKQIF